MKLVKKIVYTGTLKAITGLHIGGTNAAMNIGGPDDFVVRNPLDNIPYIPGSSLKGKLRALIEIANGETKDGKPADDLNSKAVQLFGNSSGKENGRPSRLIVRDAPLDITIGNYENTDLEYTETKTEVTINRITAAAMPREFERVPAGAVFSVSMVINVFDDDNEKELMNTLDEAIALLHDDYLGGSGSRGYGQVEMELTRIEKLVEEYRKGER